MRSTILIRDQRNEALGDRQRLARLRYQRIKTLPLEHVSNDEFP
jgi:hypothetical protein